MTFIEAIILGIIQGFTEFLPISSSGHLVLGQAILGIDQPGNEFEILVHLGTLTSIILVFYHDIKNLLFSILQKRAQKFILFILLGTVPAIFVGLGMEVFIKDLFENVKAVGLALVFTGVILFGSSFAKRTNKDHSYYTALVIGFAQAVAIIPGISRSGMTISTALFLGLSSKEAARFSFLLAIPAITGAGLLTAFDLDGAFPLSVPVSLAAFFSSSIMGILSLKWLLGWLEEGKFHYFGIYCLVVGLLTSVL